MDPTAITPDPRQLRALSHPARLRMLGILRLEGPSTATLLAQRLGLNTGATSYHLRQLAQYGFVVEDAERGSGRDRWWRAAHQATRAMEENDEAARDARSAYWQAVAVVHTETLQRAVEEHSTLPEPWREASSLSDWTIRLTPRRARALVAALETVIAETEGDDDAEAAAFSVMLHAFPQPGMLETGTRA